MIKVKGNYKNVNKNLLCRACKTEVETQAHVLKDCPEIHKDDITKGKKEDIFKEDIHRGVTRGAAGGRAPPHQYIHV